MAALLLVGDRDESVVAHRAIEESFRLAASAGIEVAPEWPGTRAIEEGGAELLARYAGIWCVPASPYESTEGALTAIRHARENNVPFLGTCGGYQHALIEFARNVAGLGSANSPENDPETDAPVIERLSCALVEVTGEIRLRTGSRAHALAGTLRLEEGYHCSFGLNAGYRERLERAGLVVSGEDAHGDARVFELASLRFYLATLFQPERAALQGRLHPFVQAFLRASTFEIMPA
jgi:CTP synthase (UTP-ammonia lyase)